MWPPKYLAANSVKYFRTVSIFQLVTLVGLNAAKQARNCVNSTQLKREDVDNATKTTRKSV